jgi:pyridoxal phosphate enzyme (YggS family)
LQDLPISWHFIGRLQKNKINNLIDLDPVLFQSLDSIELAQELDKKLKIKNKTMNCLLQINSAKEIQKAGVMPDKAIDTYKQIQDEFNNINLLGVMCIGAHTTNKDIIKQSFDITKNIFDKVNGKYCSMGMSNDFELAIECGSNMIRVGSILFK